MKKASMLLACIGLLLGGCPEGKGFPPDSRLPDSVAQKDGIKVDGSVDGLLDHGTPDQAPQDHSVPDQGKATGSEGGPCYKNGTCDKGFTCLSNLCVRLPDISIPDLLLPPDQKVVPDVPIPDHALLDHAVVPDVPILDQVVPDIPIPDQATLTPDKATPDVLIPDQKVVPDQKMMSDLPLPDLPMPDQNLVPDYAVPDQVVPDQMVPDQKVPDTGITCKHPTVAKSCSFNTTLSLTFCTIPSGCFQMGSPTSEPCRISLRETLHRVTLTRAFEISATEVTQGEYKALMNASPSYFKACGANCPVEFLSWHMATAYCNALSSKKGLATCYVDKGSGVSCTQDTQCSSTNHETCMGGKCAHYVTNSSYSGLGNSIQDCPGYRLPTEAEWEYANRAGTSSAFYSGPIASCKGIVSHPAVPTQ